jgi:aminoglycoside phosphotransferase family enzyme/predicted kinase
MIVADQSEVIAFLSRPETYGAEDVRRIDTHISAVFLAGPKAYKLKRAVVFPYLDFGTLERRRNFCEAEVAINRRTAPQIYERVAAVTREAGGALALDGAGAPVDFVVVMRRFDDSGLFDRLAEKGALSDELMRQLGDEIARFHQAAERRLDSGGYDGMAKVVALNAQDLARHAQTILDAAAVSRIASRSQAEAARVRAVLEARRKAGFVRRCHGDLHLRNICLYENRPLLFDAIEFSEDLACIDILYDLAFLLMDLEHRGLRRLANLVFNRYLAQGGEVLANLAGLAALPLFLSCRAAVRAHVGGDAALLQRDDAEKSRLIAESQAYLDLAGRVIAPPPPRFVAVGGLSGTGKSTLARALAPEIEPVPGAVVLRSDTIRKRLWGVDEFTRLPPEAYAQPVTARVYGAIADQAQAALAAGHSVIADAVHARGEERAALERLATTLSVPFTGLWLEAPETELERRVGGREPDASDATVAVLRRQLELPLGDMTWRRVDAAGGALATLAAARAALSSS